MVIFFNTDIITSAIHDYLPVDHVMGIVPLLRNILSPPPAANSPYALKVNPTVNSLFRLTKFNKRLSPCSLLAKD